MVADQKVPIGLAMPAGDETIDTSVSVTGHLCDNRRRVLKLRV